MLTKILLGTVSALVLAGTAQAQVAVSVWTNQPNTTTSPAQDATIANMPAGPADVTGTVNGINFSTSDSSATTVGTWLGNPALSSAILNNSYMLFTGQIYLNSGVNNFSISHDDGFELSLDGIGTVLSEPGPHSPDTTPFSIDATSAGTYNYTLSYGECCGGPAVLQWLYSSGAPVGSVPEPATWAMMLLGFGGIGMAMRRRRGPSTIAQIA